MNYDQIKSYSQILWFQLLSSCHQTIYVQSNIQGDTRDQVYSSNTIKTNQQNYLLMGNSSPSISKPSQTGSKFSLEHVKILSLLKRLSASKGQYLKLQMVEKMHLKNLKNQKTLDQSQKKKNIAESRIKKIDEILSYFSAKENQVDRFTKQLKPEINGLQKITAIEAEFQLRLEQMKIELKRLQIEGAILNTSNNDSTEEATFRQTHSYSNSHIEESIEESQMCNPPQWNPKQFLKRLLQKAQKSTELIENEEQAYTKNEPDYIKDLNKYEHIQLRPQRYRLSLHNHKLSVTQFTEFCSKNWCQVQFLKLVSCQIDDSKWRIFVQHAENFPNLKLVYICNYRQELDDNQIKINNLNHWKRYLSVFVEVKSFLYEVHTNQLNQKSLKEINNYVKEHPHVKVDFEEYQESDVSN